jgi:hypothetical protein
MSDLGLASGKVASPRMYCILSPGKQNNVKVEAWLLDNLVSASIEHLHDGYTLYVLKDDMPLDNLYRIESICWVTQKNQRELDHFVKTVAMGTPSLRIFTTHPPHKKD